MENASKALIIAGAILLAILIISLGIIIFSQASEITRNSSISDVEVLQFNEKFTSHDGANVRGSEVNSLLTTLVQSNIANQEDESKQVKLTVTASAWQGDKPDADAIVTSTSDTGKAQTGKTYKVESVTNNKTGLVEEINISDSEDED